jgi:hypothetical protein
MAFVPLGQQAVGNAHGVLMNMNPPPAQTPVPASGRRWVAAVNPYSTGRAMAQYISSEIALRGDTRTPAQIDTAGGLWAWQAQAVGTGGAAVQRNPHTHQANAGNTIYVSCTRDITIAKGFAHAGGYVYVFRVNAGVDYNQYAGGNAMQAEVMAVQGIHIHDIIGARRMADNQILINTHFQQATMTGAQFNAAIAMLDG